MFNSTEHAKGGAAPPQLFRARVGRACGLGRDSHPKAGLTPYDLLRIVLGMLLVSAAFLKGHQLATEPDLESGPWTSRWFMIGLIEFQLVFGVWVLSGLQPRATWRAAIGCFIVFGVASLYKIASGETSCGCFGKMPVNPWLALVIDAAAVAALCRWRPDAAMHARFVRARVALIAIAFLAAPAFASVAASHQPAALMADGQIVGDSGFVLFEPANWLGKPFPLLAHIDIGERLASDRWLVVLFHHDCPHCREAIAKYDTLAGESALDSAGSRVALVEIPPYLDSRGESVSAAGACLRGRLSDSKQWWLHTPTVLRLEGGLLIELLDESSSDEYSSFPLRERS